MLGPVFTPLAVGVRTATIQITDNAPGSPQVVTLSGTGTAPIATWSVPNLSFGSQTIGANSPTQAVKLTNTGNGNLIISSITASGDYSQTSNCIGSIAPKGNCSVTVTFTPSATWARMGTIVVASNIVTPPVFLSGMGASGGSISLSTKALTFASQLIGSTSGARAVTLTNAGSAPATIESIYASGDFAQTNTCGPILNTNCTIDITFTPSWSGSRAGEVVVNFTDPPMLEVITLKGTGQPPSTTVAVIPNQFSLTSNQKEQFQATISGIASSNVTWSVDGIIGGNATVGTISTTGLYISPKHAGTHTVMATSIATPTESAKVLGFVINDGGVFTQHNDNARTGR